MFFCLWVKENALDKFVYAFSIILVYICTEIEQNQKLSNQHLLMDINFHVQYLEFLYY